MGGPVFQSGPSGGQGGSFFETPLPEIPMVVSQINVWSGSYIDAIQLTYTNGLNSGKIGGSGGGLTTYVLSPPFNPYVPDEGEKIIEVSGRYGSYIESLTITTNFRTFPTLGGGGGSSEFRYQAPPYLLDEGNQGGMAIIGFVGSAGSYLDALGVLYGYGNQ